MDFFDVVGWRFNILLEAPFAGAFYGIAIYNHNWFALIWAMIFFAGFGLAAYQLEVSNEWSHKMVKD